jgi:hypothetical protein
MTCLVDNALDRGVDELIIGALCPGGHGSERRRGRQSQAERDPGAIQVFVLSLSGPNHRDLANPKVAAVLIEILRRPVK